MTRICSRIPARRNRSNRRIRVSALASARRRTGQPRPRQLTSTLADRGPRTDSSVMRAPRRANKPRIRTTGNGRRKAGAAGVTDENARAVEVLVGAGAAGGGAGLGGGGGGGGGGAAT